MKKKIIAVMLTVVLVTAGIGGLAYAQDDPVNQVNAEFHTHWHHDVSGDSFTNHEVTGVKSCMGWLRNTPDETEATVTAAELSLASELVLDWVEEENLTQMGPPTYEWFFGDVPEGSQASHTYSSVNFNSPEPFTPGYDASRLADKTEFCQSEGTQTQTLTITLTPRELTEGLAIHVSTGENELVNALINPPAGDDDFYLTPDRLWLGINPVGLELDTEYTYYVTIEVTPKVPKVEFMPFIHIGWHVGVASGTTSGSSVSCPPGGPVSEVGTWTWSAEGSYEWYWQESLHRGLMFSGYGQVPPLETVPHVSMTGQKLVGWGDFGTLGDIVQANFGVSFTNPDCVSKITIDRLSIIRGDGEAVFEGKLSELPFPVSLSDDLNPHQTVGLPLVFCFPDGCGGWLSPEDALALPLASYTVEIFYSVSQEGGLPLIGRIDISRGPLDAMEPTGMVPMVNMEQVLEVIELTFNDPNPEGTAEAQAVDYWAEQVEELCEGRLKINVIHNGELLTVEEVYGGIQAGIADGGNYLVDREDGFLMNLVTLLPFMGWPEQHIEDMYQTLLDKFPEMQAEWEGVTIIGTYMTTPTHIHTIDIGKVITTPNDIEDVKIFCLDSWSAEIMNAVGATAVELPVPEMYASLEQGLVEGLFSNFPLLLPFQVLELLPYHTVFGDGGINMAPMFLIMNNDVLNSLPQDIQKIILDSGHFWYDKMKEIWDALLAEELAFCEANNHTFTYLTPEEIAVWYDLVKETIHDVWIAECEAMGLPGQELYDEVLQLIKKYK